MSTCSSRRSLRNCRIARDIADAIRVMQTLKFFGVRVIYISQNIDSADEQAETLVAVHGMVDSLYLREMAKKIRRRSLNGVRGAGRKSRARCPAGTIKSSSFRRRADRRSR